MDSLIELVTFIGGGFLAVFLFRFLKPNVKKQNAEVIIKVDKIEKENKDLEAKVEENKTTVKQEIEILEQEKEKDLSVDKLADFFNKRK